MGQPIVISTKITSGTGKVKNTNGAVTAIYWWTAGRRSVGREKK